ncbi:MULTISPECIES: alpha/beta hydrolase [Lactobacillaceae]|uniref:alpha/beta hydrolase n=1 Tax=Lactobacillaceae TaxID=33958 RepID=UPI001F5052CB|nr:MULTISPECIES: alpha/beta hydrolase [Lactobacillaceae]
MNKKNLKYISLAFIIILLLGIPIFSWTRQNNSHLASKFNSPLSPIIMIPGSSARANRFEDLVKNVNKTYNQKHSLLEVTVHTDNKLTYSGSIKNGDNRPIIVIGFENNKDGYNNIKKQAKWLSIAFDTLQKRYQFNNFNAFGHSNGSLIWTYYLEHYFDSSESTLNQFQTVGAPFNFEESSSTKRTQMLNDFIKYKNNIPKNITYTSIAGTKKFSDDGIVPLASVDCGKYIYEGNIKSYTLITLTGGDAEHSDMLDNKQFISLFHHYILNNGSNTDPEQNKKPQLNSNN